MELNLRAETVTFFITVLSGVLYGLMYDFLRISRIAVRHRSYAIFIEDILFFTVIALMTFLLALSKNRGEVRAFHMIGQTLGFIIYYFTLGEAVISFADNIIKLVRLIFSFINRLLVRPLIWLIKSVLRIPLGTLRKISRLIKKMLKKAKFVLKKRRLLLYNSIVARKSDKSEESKSYERKSKNRKRSSKIAKKETH